MTDVKLDHVRKQADALGVKYHHRAGIAKIQAAIDHQLVAQQPDTPDQVEPPVMDAYARRQAGHSNPGIVIPITEEEMEKRRAKARRKNVSALVRCRIQNMNSQKKDWAGEILSVGSAKLGTFKKYVPFSSADPWHVPKIMYDLMVDKECTQFVNGVDDRGHKTRVGRMIKEYAIEVLPNLTAEEIDSMKVEEAKREGIPY